MMRSHNNSVLTLNGSSSCIKVPLHAVEPSLLLLFSGKVDNIGTQSCEEKNNTVWTIGHSTRPLEEFIAMLISFNIEIVADIRSFPGSRKFPQYNKEALEVSLAKNTIQYIHLKSLGGRRKMMPNSKNTGWRHVAFRGYADYMETDAFSQGIRELEKMAFKQRTAYLCAEAVWWRCHRSLVSDYLKIRNWKVMNIISIGKDVEHTYTAPARIINGKLNYEKE